MYEFPTEWPDEIAEVSTLPEYQNATVTLIDPDLVVETYDTETGEYTVESDGEVWSGQARIIGVRWGVNRLNEDTWNADTQTSIRVQFPRDPELLDYRIRRGVVLRVDECVRNPVLQTYVLTATSDLQGSNSAARTVQFAMSSDAEVSNDG